MTTLDRCPSVSDAYREVVAEAKRRAEALANTRPRETDHERAARKFIIQHLADGHRG